MSLNEKKGRTHSDPKSTHTTAPSAKVLEARAARERYLAELAEPCGFPDFSRAPITTQLGLDIENETIDPWNKRPTLDTKYLTKVLATTDPFMAFAVSMERPLLKAYDDGAGNQTIGVGHFTKVRASLYGKERIISDFMAAGLNRTQAEGLAREDKDALRLVKLSAHGCVALLEACKPDYERIVKDAIGEKCFDKLPINKKVALTYLAFNTGHIKPELAAAVRKGDDYQAIAGNNMMPTYNHGIPNEHLRGRVQAAYMGGKYFDMALQEPGKVDSLYGQSGQMNVLPNQLLIDQQQTREHLSKRRKDHSKAPSNQAQASVQAHPQDTKQTREKLYHRRNDPSSAPAEQAQAPSPGHLATHG